MINVITRSEQAQLFTRKGQEQNPALVLRLAREPMREFDDAGRAGCVVVGAGMNGSGQRWRHRELLAQPKVIVMRPDDNVFRSLARKVSADVMDGLHFAADIEVELQAHAGRKGERLRMQILIDGR